MLSTFVSLIALHFYSMQWTLNISDISMSPYIQQISFKAEPWESLRVVRGGKIIFSATFLRRKD